MSPYGKVVCAIDFSEVGLRALQQAIALVRQSGGELLLVHAIMPVDFPPDALALRQFDPVMYETEMLKLRERTLRETAAKWVPNDVRMRSLVVYGPPADEIVRLADAEHADVIVIGTHGMSGWRHYAYGSVAQKVLQRATCPVLVVPTRQDDS